MTPKISVLMPVYNGEIYLRESINSVLNQTFTDFEFIIIDDGSTDSTWEILTTYTKQDPRIKLFKNEQNIGLTNSLNKGLNLAKGEYIARQDADDVSLPKRFEKQTELLDNSPETILVSCDIDTIDSEGRLIGKIQRSCDPKLVPWYLLFYNHVAGHSQVMFRRKPVLDLDGYSHVNRYSEDYELWSRLAQIGDIVILPEALLQQRMHSKSLCAERGTAQQVWSLTQSRNNIKKLIGKELSLEEVENLRKFWLTHNSRNRTPKSDSVSTLNSRLKEIFQAFIQQTNQKDYVDIQLSHQLSFIISQQFLLWIKKLSIRHSLLKLILLPYALDWNPSALTTSESKSFWELPLRMLLTLVRLYSKSNFQVTL